MLWPLSYGPELQIRPRRDGRNDAYRAGESRSFCSSSCAAGRRRKCISTSGFPGPSLVKKHSQLPRSSALGKKQNAPPGTRRRRGVCSLPKPTRAVLLLAPPEVGPCAIFVCPTSFEPALRITTTVDFQHPLRAVSSHRNERAIERDIEVDRGRARRALTPAVGEPARARTDDAVRSRGAGWVGRGYRHREGRCDLILCVSWNGKRESRRRWSALEPKLFGVGPLHYTLARFSERLVNIGTRLPGRGFYIGRNFLSMIFF
jgi:hypothetical protein